MRIVLASNSQPNLAIKLSEELDLHLLIAKKLYGLATDLPSDDLEISTLIEDIHDLQIHGDSNLHFILKEYPQNIIQAQSLDIALAQIGLPVSIALMLESEKLPENRENRALIRYYRTQNKLIFFDEADSISELCNRIHQIYEKRRSSDNQTNADLT